MENLKREVKISYELTHPGLVKCYNTMESKKNYYIVFEFCSGGDLSVFLKKEKNLTPQVALNIMGQVKIAYQYLLSENILHRDIKLENILLKSENSLEIKISDFGCSKIDPCGTTICGTPKYMALELLEGVKNYDYKVDLWSLGLCFWELMFGFGSFPFSLKSRVNLKNDIKKYSGENLRFPTVPKYPDEFYDFFKKILEVSPRLRIDSQEFINHPIFNYTGKEKIFDDLNSGKIKIKTTSEIEENQTQDTEEKEEQQSSSAFKTNRDIYKKKITEVELIRETFENMKTSLQKTWASDFLVNYETLMIIVLKKAQNKNDLILNSFNKKKNVFECEKFDEFLSYPNEYVDLKNELETIKNALATIDKNIY